MTKFWGKIFLILVCLGLISSTVWSNDFFLSVERAFKEDLDQVLVLVIPSESGEYYLGSYSEYNKLRSAQPPLKLVNQDFYKTVYGLLSTKKYKYITLIIGANVEYSFIYNEFIGIISKAERDYNDAKGFSVSISYLFDEPYK